MACTDALSDCQPVTPPPHPQCTVHLEIHQRVWKTYVGGVVKSGLEQCLHMLTCHLQQVLCAGLGGSSEHLSESARRFRPNGLPVRTLPLLPRWKLLLRHKELSNQILHAWVDRTVWGCGCGQRGRLWNVWLHSPCTGAY
jgi:hypothetical protein